MPFKELPEAQTRYNPLLELKAKYPKLMKKINTKKHICRFNDGECNCDCYIAGLADAFKIYKNK